MKYYKHILLAIVATILSVNVYAAGDATAGKSKAAMCAACHGATGISPNDLWPNLAGQKEGYLLKQLKAFKAGKRTDPMMNAMIAGLKDADLANLAAFYAGLK